jgi:hypothetical protein
MTTQADIQAAIDAYQELINEVTPTIESFKARAQAILDNPNDPDAEAKLAAMTEEYKGVQTSVNPQGTLNNNAVVNAFNAASSEDRIAMRPAVTAVQDAWKATVGIAVEYKAIKKKAEEAVAAAKNPEKDTDPAPADPGAPGSTNTDQQNKEYAKSGSADDDSGSNQSSTNGTGTTASNNGSGSNSGTTTAGKSSTPAAKKNAPKPGRRLQNPLGEFSSYTYQLTLYMITPDAYDAFIQSGRKTIDVLTGANAAGSSGGAYIIAQSGGINNKSSKRAPGFELDYYIDDLKIVSNTNGKETQTSSNVSEMSFNIYEPYGFSFISKLKFAAEELQKKSKTKNFEGLQNPSKQFFILGVRFQGYDKNGKVINGTETFSSTGDVLDPNATKNGGVFQTFYDIMLTGIKFKIDGRATTYNITAASLPPTTAMGIKRGRIDRGATIVANTVREAIDGEGEGVEGLLTKLNKTQQDSLKNKSIEIPNVYKVRFIGNKEELGFKELETATIVSKADLDKSKWRMSNIKNSTGVNDSTSTAAKPDSTKRQIVFPSDTPILQAITQIVAQSSYLEDAMKVVYTDSLQPDSGTDSDDEQKPDTNKTIRWYNLSSEVKCLGWDNKVGDFAFEITYVIQPYDTPVVMSAYTNAAAKYYGPHKRYEYWYTGKNSEIINYEQTLNNAYFNVAIAPTGDGTSQGGATDVSTVASKRQNESRLGKPDVGMEAQNSYMTSLFDPGSYAEAKITILGDPDFLVQESPGSINDVYNQFYGTDGYTINANGGQVFIEINFKEAQDYKNSTGLLSINESILFWKYPSAILKDIASRGGGVSYLVIKVTSMFKGGKFTQDINCSINTFGGATDDAPADKAGGREPAKPATQASARAVDNAIDSGSATNSSGSTNEGTGLTPSPATTDAQVNGASTTTDPAPLTPTAATTSEVTSPTGGASTTTPPAPAEPAPLVLPNPTPTARTTFAGARIKAYQSGTSIFVSVFLPSGLELTNVNGWGPAQWDAQIERANPQDLSALTSLKASYDTVITPLVDDVKKQLAENEAARTEYNNKKNAVGTGTNSVPVNKAVVDDDATGG